MCEATGTALEKRQIVESRSYKALPVIERGVSLLRCHVLEILHSTWRKHSAENFSSTVVNQVTPGVRS